MLGGGLRACQECKAIFRAEIARCPNDGGAIESIDRDPLIGSTIEHYVVDELIGVGAVGRVYRVHHSRLVGKQFALKVLIGDFASTPMMRLRFAKEAESAARLSHPNIVGVIDFGCTQSGVVYLAMELVEGETIGAMIERGPIPPERVIQLARGMCDGLAHAHDHNLIHRDFKPDNVMVAADEIPRITDFGLAISTDRQDARLTTTGITVGTPAYSAPEQATGKRVDARADLYGLGVTLHDMLTCKLPFDGDPVEVMTRKLLEPAPSIASYGVSGKLVSLVDRLLERRPEDRLQSAREVRAVLDEIVTDELILQEAATIVVRPPAEEPVVDEPVVEEPVVEERETTVFDVPLLPRSRRRWAIVAASFVAVAVAGAALALVLNRNDAPVEQPVAAADKVIELQAPTITVPSTESQAESKLPDEPAPVVRVPPSAQASKVRHTTPKSTTVVVTPPVRDSIPEAIPEAPKPAIDPPPPPLPPPLPPPVPPESKPVTRDVPVPKPPPPKPPSEIMKPRLPAFYSARTLKELGQVLATIESEAIDRGGVASSIRGVTAELASIAFDSFVPGELIEIHPSNIYYAIVRGSRAGKSASRIASELRAAGL